MNWTHVRAAHIRVGDDIVTITWCNGVAQVMQTPADITLLVVHKKPETFTARDIDDAIRIWESKHGG